ncbi:MAG: hypothetical protein JW928_09620 [Candidatus Aureabacteria bacterium]|nr:hypothetical protein [Candidatus Auribacterota bacterium]
MKKLIVLLVLLVLPIVVYSAKGPEIPISNVTLEEAIEIAKDAFEEYKTKKNNEAFYSPFIITKVIYTDYFEEHPKSEWAWYVKFVHPIQNDCTYTFKITDDKKVVLFQETT